MNLALFDFDGTITRGDSWTPFMRLAGSPARKVIGYTVCSGAEKATRIRQRYDLRRYREIFAYGDTVDDRAMLALAGRRYYRWREELSSAPRVD